MQQQWEGMFDTFNYTTTAHHDKADDGHCMSGVTFMEEHRATASEC